MDTNKPIVVIGAGPAGIASALALSKVGKEVVLLERYPEARPAGNVINLWPPPIKALKAMGVDIDDLGAPTRSTFRGVRGNTRAEIRLPQQVIDDYGGGFIGLLRPQLYKRMLAALHDGILETNRTVEYIKDRGADVLVTLSDWTEIEASAVIGTDGINSLVRQHLWGETPLREHRLHVIAGYTFDDVSGAERNETILSHDRIVQGTYSSLRDDGRDGYMWWVLQAWNPQQEPPANLKSHALNLTQRFPAGPLTALAEAIDPTQIQRWLIRDRKPLKSWSKGRITIAGDAAHPTSPYAAYGAGMGIGDGYALGQCLAHVDMQNTSHVAEALRQYEERRIPHTTSQVQQAYVLGQAFHHAPAPLRPLRDLILDRTPMLQKQVGERKSTRDHRSAGSDGNWSYRRAVGHFHVQTRCSDAFQKDRSALRQCDSK